MTGGKSSTGGRLVAIGATVFVIFACGGIDSEEMNCEEAVVRIEGCCEKIDVGRFNCVEQQGGCGTPPRSPAFTKKASACIMDASCSDLQEKGKCDGLRQLHYGPYPNQDRVAFEKEACR